MADDASVREVAERVFRTVAIDHLTSTVEECSISSTYELSSHPDPLSIPPSLIAGLHRPLPPSTRLAVRLHPTSTEFEAFDEVSRDEEEMGAASTSMALSRAPAKDVSGIKGSSSNVPFMPGGFDDEVENVIRFAQERTGAETEESAFLNFQDLLSSVPGLSRTPVLRDPQEGKKKEKEEDQPAQETPSLDLDTADIFDLLDFVSGGEKQSFLPPPEEKKEEETEKEEEAKEEGELDGELKEVLATPLPASSTEVMKLPTSAAEFGYAYVIPTHAAIPEYEGVRKRMAKKYPFELDPFQQAAVVCMEKGESVFVAAHTSAGKTVVAEYAIALCKAHKTRAIYTSPIKALSNQKYRDLKLIFDDVGLVTGDIQIAPEAFCLIMTTEILRSMLYNGSEVVRELEWVVFDEVHYINDADRGHVWEEVLIMLPAHVGIIMLSATVPNCVEFADWVGRIKNRRLAVVSTHKRPVPLEHFLYTGQDGKTKKDLFCIVDKDGEFSYPNYKKAVAAKQGIKANAQAGPQGGPMRGGGGNGGMRGGGAQGRGGGQQRGGGVGGGGQRGGGGWNNGGRGGGQGGGGGGRGFTKNDKNIFINLVDHLRSIDKLPMVCFVFSRKRCDDNAQLLRSIDLTTAVEKSHVTTFFTQCISRLKGSDKELPQVLTMKELCLRGFAVHHSGILPILKEVVELLFQKGYVKILFATETFAMGVNMPARTVVFDSLTKHDGTSLRLLQPGEYIQMAGRAGRRGLDSTGTVIVLCKADTVPDSAELQTVMKGKAAKLESQFRVTYSMLLNLLRAEQLRIEDMLQRSYVESFALRKGKERKSKLEEARQSLCTLPRVQCSLCEGDGGIDLLHETLTDFIRIRADMWHRWCAISGVDKLFGPGRLLVLSSAQHGLQNTLAILLKEESKGGTKSLQVLVSCSEEEEFAKSKELKEDDRFWEEESVKVYGTLRYGLEGVNGSGVGGGKRRFKIVGDVAQSAIVAICQRNLKVDVTSILGEAKQRELPRFRSNPLSDGVARIISELDSLANEYAVKGAPVTVIGRDIKVDEVSLYEDTLRLLSMRDGWMDEGRLRARHCALLHEHMTAHREMVRVHRQIARLEFELSAESLTLSQEYRDKLKVLGLLGYVEPGNMVSFKGRVACEIHHQELLMTELILDYKLHSRTPAEIAAMLSATTCQHKAPEGVKLEENSVLKELRADLEAIQAKIQGEVKKAGLQVNDGYEEIRFDLMDVVYHWANGMPFAEIMQLTQAQEGLIVRCIQRLGEVAKDVRNAARIVGDPALQEKMEAVQAAIKRDIVFAASLYTTV